MDVMGRWGHPAHGAATRRQVLGLAGSGVALALAAACAPGGGAGGEGPAAQSKGPVTIRSVLDTLEESYPMLRGTIRDHVTGKRRPFLRFFACQEDLSHGSGRETR